MRPAAGVSPDQHLLAQVPGQLGQREPGGLDVVGGGVRAGVPGSQGQGQRFPRSRRRRGRPRRHRVEAEGLLPGGRGLLLLQLAQVRGNVCTAPPVVPGLVSRVRCAGGGRVRCCRPGMRTKPLWRMPSAAAVSLGSRSLTSWAILVCRHADGVVPAWRAGG